VTLTPPHKHWAAEPLHPSIFAARQHPVCLHAHALPTPHTHAHNTTTRTAPQQHNCVRADSTVAAPRPQPATASRVPGRSTHNQLGWALGCGRQPQHHVGLGAGVWLLAPSCGALASRRCKRTQHSAAAAAGQPRACRTPAAACATMRRPGGLIPTQHVGRWGCGVPTDTPTHSLCPASFATVLPRCLPPSCAHSSTST
jgi:hypothetical protein